MWGMRVPELSVVVPTCQRPESLRKCLVSLRDSDTQEVDYEIIIVDDGSDHDIQPLVNEFKGVFPGITLLRQTRKGPASARNAGVRMATSPVVAFIDDDCRVSPSWLKGMVRAHRKYPQAAAVGGFTVPGSDHSTVVIGQFLSNGSIEVVLRGGKEVIFFPTCNVSIKKSFIPIKVFDETFALPGGEDLEFFWRLFKDGKRFVYDRSLLVFHDRNPSLASFLRQAYAYGRGNILVQIMHKDHPLLKELKTGICSFWLGTLINMVKIPRFSCVLGNRLLAERTVQGGCGKLTVYAMFAVHKIFYVAGTIDQFVRHLCRSDRRSVPT